MIIVLKIATLSDQLLRNIHVITQLSLALETVMHEQRSWSNQIGVFRQRQLYNTFCKSSFFRCSNSISH